VTACGPAVGLQHVGTGSYWIWPAAFLSINLGGRSAAHD